jgi:hypothetical protein
MRESRLSGSVEGVVSNHDPYSDFMFRTELKCYRNIRFRFHSKIRRDSMRPLSARQLTCS